MPDQYLIVPTTRERMPPKERPEETASD